MSSRANSTTSHFPIYAAAFVAAFSAIAYELMLASYASFLLGATIFQYSLVISLMMASMGLGALVTHGGGMRHLRLGVAEAFLAVEILLALAAAVALPLLYYVFAIGISPRPIVGFFVVFMGAMVGMEIPLLNQITRSQSALSRILFFDYLGGFIGGILFPVILAPRFGLFRVAAILSVVNAGLALWMLFQFREKLGRRFPSWCAASGLALAVSLFFLVQAEEVRRAMERALFHIGGGQ